MSRYQRLFMYRASAQEAMVTSIKSDFYADDCCTQVLAINNLKRHESNFIFGRDRAWCHQHSGN